MVFIGFKLHVLIHGKGGIMAAQILSDNIDDRRPLEAYDRQQGKVFGDKEGAYIRQCRTQSTNQPILPVSWRQATAITTSPLPIWQLATIMVSALWL